MKTFEFLEHPADIKIRAFGKDLQEVFINSALGMMEFLFDKPKMIPDKKETIEASAENVESLLVNWLAEILALSNIHKRIFVNFAIKEFSETKIVAEVTSARAVAIDDIKAVTYSELAIKKMDDKWIANVVYDI